MSKQVVPQGAIRVGYDYYGSKGYFYIGKLSNQKWWWDALGNNGEESTADTAIESARLWIKDSRKRIVNFTSRRLVHD